MNESFCMSYSLGKDSTLALYKMIQDGYTPVALVITVNDEGRSLFHGVDNKLIKRVSESLGIPVIQAVCTPENYKEQFSNALIEARKLGATKCVFGDIDIEEHRLWGEEMCSLSGLQPVFPHWQRNREDIAREFVNSGFKAIIKAVSKQYNVPIDYLGKELTNEVFDEFGLLGIDICGENGEYHTFVYDGPMFKEPIRYKNSGVFESEYAYSYIIEVE